MNSFPKKISKSRDFINKLETFKENNEKISQDQFNKCRKIQLNSTLFMIKNKTDSQLTRIRGEPLLSDKYLSKI
jgi:hypothetical protein